MLLAWTFLNRHALASAPIDHSETFTNDLYDSSWNTHEPLRIILVVRSTSALVTYDRSMDSIFRLLRVT